MGQMFRDFIKSYSNRFVSRWLILAVDSFIIICTFWLACFLRYRFNFQYAQISDVFWNLSFVVPVYIAFFLGFKSYEGIIRHTSITDVSRVFAACVGAGALIMLTTLGVRNFGQLEWTGIPHSIVIAHTLVSTVALIFLRFLGKAIYNSVRTDVTEKLDASTKVLIFGAGASGIITKQTLENDGKSGVKVIGFIDDNPSLQGKRLEGVQVYSKEQALEQVVPKREITQVIFSIQNISSSRKRELINDFIEKDIRVKSVPPVDSWINGQLSAKQIRDVSIDDLLGREAIKLDKDPVKKEVAGKVVFITGAAGSIGSEIARQVFSYGAEKLVLIDQAESALFEVEQELLERKDTKVELVCCVADVCNSVRMNYLFEEYQPELVYHAAAYKHVPMMELNPTEAAAVNILGTKNIADLSVEYGVDKFVLVSTDKAVNPTNIMGATKRAAEMYCRTMEANNEDTHFITTRFGNVLGSNGSVIPTFRKQIENGGPIKVTHPDITRYFMTIPEACSLVLEAGAMGVGGEIFIFDMGQSMKIVDLAKKMIKLSGLELDKDIKIEFSGLRPGEKLYEELLANEENTTKTHHEKIMIAKIQRPETKQVCAGISAIQIALETDKVMDLVAALKELVPEFKSQNSQFEKLDATVI